MHDLSMEEIKSSIIEALSEILGVASAEIREETIIDQQFLPQLLITLVAEKGITSAEVANQIEPGITVEQLAEKIYITQ